MKYPCGEPAHRVILGTRDDMITAVTRDGSIVMEYRACGCVTWRAA